MKELTWFRVPHLNLLQVQVAQLQWFPNAVVEYHNEYVLFHNLWILIVVVSRVGVKGLILTKAAVKKYMDKKKSSADQKEMED